MDASRANAMAKKDLNLGYSDDVANNNDARDFHHTFACPQLTQLQQRLQSTTHAPMVTVRGQVIDLSNPESIANNMQLIYEALVVFDMVAGDNKLVNSTTTTSTPATPSKNASLDDRHRTGPASTTTATTPNHHPVETKYDVDDQTNDKRKVSTISINSGYPFHNPSSVIANKDTSCCCYDIGVTNTRSLPPFEDISHREWFYILLNHEANLACLPYAHRLARTMLEEFSYDSNHSLPENYQYFDYTADEYERRLDQIYDALYKEAQAYSPVSDPIFKTKADVVERILQLAPFDQTDGAWLRNVTPVGPMDEVQAILNSLWIEEMGNGKPEENHCNIYTSLLRSCGVHLPDVRSRAYIEHQEFLDSAFTLPAFKLAVSQFSSEFFPEILGMTLQLEWEVVECIATVKLYEYHGIDPTYYRLHIAIDNAASGHAAKAKKAVMMFLDRVREQGGEQAVQQYWRRIWNGYLCFSQLGTLGEDLQNKILGRAQTETLDKNMLEMVQRKARYAGKNHNRKCLGAKTLNEWFATDPKGLLDQLANSSWINAGDPDSSRFFALTSPTGPMYKVFNDSELRLWRDWVKSLRPSSAPQQQQLLAKDSGFAMCQLISKLRSLQWRIQHHHWVTLTGPDPKWVAPGGRHNTNDEKEATQREQEAEVEPPLITKSVHWWFKQRPTALLHALKRDFRVVPGQPAQSPFVTQVLVPCNPMADSSTTSSASL